MNTTRREKNLKELVLGRCWRYIYLNFPKFNEDNKIKISLALLQKSMPQEIIGSNQSIVVMNQIKKDNKELGYNIGTATSDDTRHSS